MIKTLFKSHSLAIGLAMFSMFFGAGNIIFPLAVGQYAGDKNFYAISGLIITAAIMPIIGVIAMILYEGNYRQFFGRLGSMPGFILSFVIISLLGPLGSTPRCIALSYTTLKSSFPDLSQTAFSALACVIIYALTVRKNYILKILGWVLTPLLLSSLLLIILIGLLNTPDMQPSDYSKTSMFLYGLGEGYNTMDLLAAFFFSSTILNILKMSSQNINQLSLNHINIAFRASLIGAVLLAGIYIGFSYLAAYHGAHLGLIAKDELLGSITMKIAGPQAGILVCLTIALACLTTAIALISAFTDFIQTSVFKEKISYRLTLIASLILTFFISTFEFTGISAFLGPILHVCYPGLIVLTFLNIIHYFTNFKPVKAPVFIVFTISAYLYFF